MLKVLGVNFETRLKYVVTILKGEIMTNEQHRTEVRKMPDTVRTAGSENVRDTDMGTVLEKPKTTVKKTTVTGGKRIPDTVRTAGQDDVMATDN